MAQRDTRPEDHEPPMGGFGYLTSLGLDDDDGLDAAMHDSNGEFDDPWLQRPEAAPMPGHAIGAVGGQSPVGQSLDRRAPVADGDLDVPDSHGRADPTAGWALPDQEEPAFPGHPSGAHLGAPDDPHDPPQAEPDGYDFHDAPGAAQPEPHQLDYAESGPDVPDFGAFPEATTSEIPLVGEPPAVDAWGYPLVDHAPPPPVDMDHDDVSTRHDDPGRPVPAPHDAAPDGGSDTWQDEWQPESVGSLHPDLHRPPGAGVTPVGGRRVPSLSAETVLRRRAARPKRGWRRAVYSVSGGRVNPGMSAAELREQEIFQRVRTPLSGCHRLAVISLKGGVGKTTTTAALGSVLATLRGDRVIAVDANPDRGTLAERINTEPKATVRALLDEGERLTRYADVRQFTLQAPTRLEVLASDSDPGVSQAFSERDYRESITILERFYNLILTDCGTGLLHSAMRGILGLADSLVIVSSASLDGARSASATLDWLEAHGLMDVVNRAVTVISTVRPGGGTVDVDRLEDHFAHRCRSVVTIPYDPHLEAGGVLDLDELVPETRDAYYELAAEVGEGFLLTDSEPHNGPYTRPHTGPHPGR